LISSEFSYFATGTKWLKDIAFSGDYIGLLCSPALSNHSNSEVFQIFTLDGSFVGELNSRSGDAVLADGQGGWYISRGFSSPTGMYHVVARDGQAEVWEDTIRFDSSRDIRIDIGNGMALSNYGVFSSRSLFSSTQDSTTDMKPILANAVDILEPISDGNFIYGHHPDNPTICVLDAQT